MPQCEECFRFGHEKVDCLKTYATVTSVAPAEGLFDDIMGKEEAEGAASHVAVKEVSESLSPGKRKGNQDSMGIQGGSPAPQATQKKVGDECKSDGHADASSLPHCNEEPAAISGAQADMTEAVREESPT